MGNEEADVPIGFISLSSDDDLLIDNQIFGLKLLNGF